MDFIQNAKFLTKNHLDKKKRREKASDCRERDESVRREHGNGKGKRRDEKGEVEKEKVKRRDEKGEVEKEKGKRREEKGEVEKEK